MKRENGKKNLNLIKKRESLEGTKIFRMLLNLATSQYAVNRNYRELKNTLDLLDGNLEIWSVNNRRKFQAFLREVSRLLHNYLSSTFSLIRHNVNLCKDFNCQELDQEYSNKVNSLVKNQIVVFVKDLRTFAQHIGLPLLEAKITFKKNEQDDSQLKQKILLDKNTLNKWKNWNKGSKDYLESHKEINLKLVLREYQLQIKTFYQWFYKKVTDLYSEQLEEFARIDSEIGKLSDNLKNQRSTHQEKTERKWRCIWNCGFVHQDIAVIAQHEVKFCPRRRLNEIMNNYI